MVVKYLLLFSTCLSSFSILLVLAAPVLQKGGPSAPAMPYMGGPRIAILQMYNSVGFFARLGALTRKNKQRYASRHNYEFIESSPFGTSGLLTKVDCGTEGAIERLGEEGCYADGSKGWHIDERRAPTFGKIKLSLAACVGRKDWWLLWSDADALVVNQTVKLESLIDDGYDIMLAYDWLMINAGVILWKCSDWNIDFLSNVYGARSFDKARALDQSALQTSLDKLSDEDRDNHLKIIPKHALNVYLEEYRAGDFLIHMAGKLYEATEKGLFAIANQLDVFSKVEDVEDISAFFNSRYLLNAYSGTCPVKKGHSQHECKPNDPRRLKLNETLGSMSIPNRYRHVGLRYSWLKNWKDKYDVPGWNEKKRKLEVEEMPAPPPLPAGEVLEKHAAENDQKDENIINDALNHNVAYKEVSVKGKDPVDDHADEKPGQRINKHESGSVMSWFGATMIIIILVIGFFAGPGLWKKAELEWQRRMSMRAHKAK